MAEREQERLRESSQNSPRRLRIRPVSAPPDTSALPSLTPHRTITVPSPHHHRTIKTPSLYLASLHHYSTFSIHTITTKLLGPITAGIAASSLVTAAATNALGDHHCAMAALRCWLPSFRNEAMHRTDCSITDIPLRNVSTEKALRSPSY